jgi:AcrR family transcriptional regulator
MALSSRGVEKAARRRRRAYHHGDLKEALIEAGLGLLAESGNPAALGLREASRRVGVSQAAPYAHFRDKRALLAAVAERGFRTFAVSMLRSAGALAPGEERLAALAQGYVAFALENPALYRLMFGPDLAIRETETALAEAAGASFRVLLESLGGDPDAPATAAAALAAWSFAHGLALLLIDGRVRPDEVGAKDVASAVAAAARRLRVDANPAPATDSRAEAKNG